ASTVRRVRLGNGGQRQVRRAGHATAPVRTRRHTSGADPHRGRPRRIHPTRLARPHPNPTPPHPPPPTNRHRNRRLNTPEHPHTCPRRTPAIAARAASVT